MTELMASVVEQDFAGYGSGRIVKTSQLLSALGNPKRFEIVMLLRKQELTVGDIALALDITQSALSQHLSKLKAVNMVTGRRDAQKIYYSLTPSTAPRIVDHIVAVNAAIGGELR